MSTPVQGPKRNTCIRFIWERCWGPIYVWLCTRKIIRNRLAPYLASEKYSFLYSHRGTGLGPEDELRRLKRRCRFRSGSLLAVGIERGNELKGWCGTGIQTIVAIDVRAFPKEWSRIRSEMAAKGIRVHFVVMDAQALGFQPNCFDVIYSQGLLEHVVDVDSFLVQCDSAMRPWGKLHVYFGPLWRSYGGSTHLGMLGYDHLMVPWDEYLRYARLVGDGWEHWAETGLFCRLSWAEIHELVEKHFLVDRIALLGSPDTRWFRKTYPAKWQRLLERYPEKELCFRLASITAHRRPVALEEVKAEHL